MNEFFGMKFAELFQTRDVFHDDLRKSAYTLNPTIISEIDLVYVLSGRTTVLGADADGLKREFDHSDDLERLHEGIRIATTVNALRAKRKPEQLKTEDWVTPIFYNGRTIHNKHLREALERGLVHYPKNLFIIHNINPENTIGQVQSFKEYLSTHSHKNIAVVSSAYHLARVARTIGSDSPQTWNKDEQDHPICGLNIFLYGIHKQEKRQGIIDDIKGEYSAMRRYSSGTVPSISRLQGRNTFFNDEELGIYKSFQRIMFWNQINSTASAYEESGEHEDVPIVFQSCLR